MVSLSMVDAAPPEEVEEEETQLATVLICKASREASWKAVLRSGTYGTC